MRRLLTFVTVLIGCAIGLGSASHEADAGPSPAARRGRRSRPGARGGLAAQLAALSPRCSRARRRCRSGRHRSRRDAALDRHRAGASRELRPVSLLGRRSLRRRALQQSIYRAALAVRPCSRVGMRRAREAQRVKKPTLGMTRLNPYAETTATVAQSRPISRRP